MMTLAAPVNRYRVAAGIGTNAFNAARHYAVSVINTMVP